MDHRTVMDLAGTDAAAYIRKSRLEEGMDTQEVLSKHQKALVEYAAAHQIHLIEIYPEVVSGESLYARPQMLRLLQDVEEGCRAVHGSGPALPRPDEGPGHHPGHLPGIRHADHHT